jgi:hypothetical protein
MTIIDFNNEKEKRVERADQLLYEAHCEKFGTYEEWDADSVHYILEQLIGYFDQFDFTDAVIIWMTLNAILKNYESKGDEQTVISNVMHYIWYLMDYYLRRGDVDEKNLELMEKIEALVRGPRYWVSWPPGAVGPLMDNKKEVSWQSTWKCNLEIRDGKCHYKDSQTETTP